MHQEQKDFCFCTLALGKKYRIFSQQLAEDLAEKFPGVFLVIYTDEPKDFHHNSNVLAYKHNQQGVLFCYHDKRFPLAKALSKFRVAIFLDADMRIVNEISGEVYFPPGITAGHQENLIEHIKKYTPEKLESTKQLLSKLNLDIASTKYIGESIFIVARDEGREKEFIKQWGMIGRYFELKGYHSGEGSVMGLAASQVGWIVQSQGEQELRKVCKHLGGTTIQTQSTVWDDLNRKLSYKYRLNKARLMALKDFSFYYS